MSSYPTLHEVRTAADDYWQVWQQLLTLAPELRRAIGQHSPDTLGWKVEGDLAPLELAERLYELGDYLFMAPVTSERAILTIRKPRAIALDTLQHIKILQRRPSRPEDALGADSLDFVVLHGLPKLDEVKKAVGAVEVMCALEHNEAHDWVSLRYQQHEFKLMDHHIWEVCVREAADLIDLDL